MKQFAFAILLTVTIVVPTWAQKKLPASELLEQMTMQYKQMMKLHKDTTQFPRSCKPNGSLVWVRSDDWTSGFFSGTLWYLSELTKGVSLQHEARRWMTTLEMEKYNRGTHDLGFMMYCSYGNAQRLAPDDDYKRVLMQSAVSLCRRYNPIVGLIRSWDFSAKGKDWKFPVIIDNMMNLEMLMWAFRESKDSSFYKIAVTHANTTMKYHFRTDNSSYHVVDYDPENGQVRWKGTHQGFGDQSAWARGQAWGFYGFTVMYRETKNPVYLQQAQKIADFMLNHKNMPKDMVPYWDFDAGINKDEPRDASAGAVLCSGLYEFAGYLPAGEGKKYLKAADKIFSSLASPAYFATPESNCGFMLMHSVGNKRGNSEVDVPLVYADYYFTEAFKRRKDLGRE